jgi:hypothetical protein
VACRLQTGSFTSWTRGLSCMGWSQLLLDDDDKVAFVKYETLMVCISKCLRQQAYCALPRYTLTACPL